MIRLFNNSLVLIMCLGISCFYNCSGKMKIIRVEAENAMFSGEETNPAQIVNDPDCSGGKYVDTRDGNLTFPFLISQAGNYKISTKIRAAAGYKVNKFWFDGEHA